MCQSGRKRSKPKETGPQTGSFLLSLTFESSSRCLHSQVSLKKKGLWSFLWPVESCHSPSARTGSVSRAARHIISYEFALEGCKLFIYNIINMKDPTCTVMHLHNTYLSHPFTWSLLQHAERACRYSDGKAVQRTHRFIETRAGFEPVIRFRLWQSKNMIDFRCTSFPKTFALVFVECKGIQS